MIFDTAIEKVLAEKDKKETTIVKLGTVAAIVGGRAKVKHYGESVASEKEYTFIDGYFPEVGDKVAMLPQANTYIIIGKVMDEAPVEKYATIEYVDETFLPVAYKNKLEADGETLTFSDNALVPSTTNADDIGSSSKYFKTLYIKKLILDGAEYTEIKMDRIEVKSGGTTYSLIATVSSGIVTLTPSTDDKWALGTKSYKLKEAWLGLFRGAWKSGNTAERQVSWNSSNALIPDTNNSVDLGSSTYGFAKLFIDTIVGAKSQYQSASSNNVAWSSASDIIPNNTNVVNLGSSAKQFNKVYAKEFYINGTLLDISGITLDTLTTKYGSTNYTLTLSVQQGGSSYQHERLEPSVNGKFDLGSSSKKFRYLYLSTLYAEAWSDGARNLSFDSSHNIIPDTTNAISLGSSAKQLDKIYAKEIYSNGTLIDISAITVDKLVTKYGSTNYTLTLSVQQGGSSYQYEKLEPSVNGKFDLGSSSYKFRNLYLSTLYASTWDDGVRNISFDSSHNLNPDITNAVSLGTSNKQYKNIYGQNIYVNGTAVSSDRRKKEEITALDWRYEEFFKRLKPVSYKFKDGTSGRKHTGFIAQEVEEAAEKAGFTDKDIAVVVKDPEDNYYLRYEEIIAVQTEVIQKLLLKVENLEFENRSIESRLAKLEKIIYERR